MLNFDQIELLQRTKGAGKSLAKICTTQALAENGDDPGRWLDALRDVDLQTGALEQLLHDCRAAGIPLLTLDLGRFETDRLVYLELFKQRALPDDTFDNGGRFALEAAADMFAMGVQSGGPNYSPSST